MINRIVLVGRLTRDPEVKSTATPDRNVCNFTIAVDNRTKKGEEKTTSFIPCVAFTPTAELVGQYLKKGSLAGVEGRLTQRNFTRQDGSKGTTYEVVCDNVQFLEPKGASVDDVKFDDIPSQESEVTNLDTLDLPDDDLPF
ncbi:MAG: single-stranded DNA-binding protein [Coprobacillus sp.]|nr:single-stranded DNA-binding protein [Coprobacillus sp.]